MAAHALMPVVSEGSSSDSRKRGGSPWMSTRVSICMSSSVSDPLLSAKYQSSPIGSLCSSESSTVNDKMSMDVSEATPALAPVLHFGCWLESVLDFLPFLGCCPSWSLPLAQHSALVWPFLWQLVHCSFFLFFFLFPPSTVKASLLEPFFLAQIVCCSCSSWINWISVLAVSALPDMCMLALGDEQAWLKEGGSEDNSVIA